jgi:alpha-ribazole phosphatase
MTTVETRWWWIRHAPVPDGGHIYGQRDLDCDCSDAEVFAALASELPHDAMWVTSHLARTHQTAAAIRTAMGERAPIDEPSALPEFAEQHLGDWQGLVRKEFFAARRAQARPGFGFGPAHERAPNGESFQDLVARVAPTVERLSAAHRGRDIVAVTHGGTIRAALTQALRLDADVALAFVIDNCSITRIDHLGDGEPERAWRVGAVNHRPWSRGGIAIARHGAAAV